MLHRNEKVYNLFRAAGALNLYICGGKAKKEIVESRLKKIKFMLDELIKNIDEIV